MLFGDDGLQGTFPGPRLPWLATRAAWPRRCGAGASGAAPARPAAHTCSACTQVDASGVAEERGTR